MLKSHYSPIKPLRLEEGLLAKIDRQKGRTVVIFRKEPKVLKKVVQLTENGDLQEYAVRLFAAIHSWRQRMSEQSIVEPSTRKRNWGSHHGRVRRRRMSIGWANPKKKKPAPAGSADTDFHTTADNIITP
ncbi:MAG: Sua5 family C-terminal domain-containing protein [Saprospiraceae bacterium]